MRAITLCAIIFFANILLSMDSKFDHTMMDILKSYEIIQKNLSEDKTEEIENEISKIKQSIVNLDLKTATGKHVKKYPKIKENISKAISKLEKAQSISQYRESFKKLSKPIVLWVTLNKPESKNIVYCSMSRGSWIQEGDDIKNPYYGKMMLNCGEFVHKGD